MPDRKRLPRLSMREWVRLALVASLLIAAWRYALFARYVLTGRGAPVARPTVADAFLPLGGVAALKAWLATGRIDALHPAALVVVLATLVTALLFRRAACSWLCPFGMLSEYLARLGVRIAGRNVEVPRWLDRTLLALKYAGTLAILVLLFATPPAQILDFMRMPLYSVADMQLFDVYAALPVGLIAAVLVVCGVSVFVKSFWCRYLCPYGAVQGILGLLSPVTLQRDEARCSSCGRCDSACPNCVAVSHSATVVSGECMGCATCVSSCPKPGALRFRLLGRFEVDPGVFGVLFLGVFFGIAVIAAVAGHWNSALTAVDYRTLVHAAADVRMPGLGALL
jgi:polyferredoxin